MDILEAADVLNAGFLSWRKRTGINFQDSVKTFLEDYFLLKFSGELIFSFYSVCFAPSVNTWRSSRSDIEVGGTLFNVALLPSKGLQPSR